MYEKHNWVNGEVISQDKLNNMEDGIATGGGIYTYEEVVAFDGEVTTVSGEGGAIGEITLQGELPKTDIHVTFNGQDYTLPHGYTEGPGEYWGEVGDNGPSFTNFPVFVGEDGSIYTSEAGTYSLKINETAEKFIVNDGFKSASENVLIATLDPNTHMLNKTFKEIKDANDTRLVIIKISDEESGGRTEVVVNVYVDDLELVSIGYNASTNKVESLLYHAASLNSYPVVRYS